VDLIRLRAPRSKFPVAGRLRDHGPGRPDDGHRPPDAVGSALRRPHNAWSPEPVKWYDPAVAFARWDPIRDLLIHQRLDRFAPDQTGWKPPVDLFETAEAYIVTAELPGLTRDDLRIDFHDSRLTISGIRRDTGAACEHYHRLERGHGTFSRAFLLPQPIEVEGIVADLRDGVLRVTCPKTSDVEQRRILVT